LATETLIVSVSAPPSSSVTVAETSAVPRPESSDHVHLKDPVWASGSKTSSEEKPWTPQSTELPRAGKVSAEPGSVQLLSLIHS
jgi:hypothetical protein